MVYLGTVPKSQRARVAGRRATGDGDQPGLGRPTQVGSSLTQSWSLGGLGGEQGGSFSSVYVPEPVYGLHTVL